MASLKHRLEGSLEGTLGGISYIFLLCFTVLLKAITEVIYKWVYLQVPLVYDYSTYYTKRVLMRLVHQPLTYN